MKKNKVFFYFLMFFPLVITVCALFFLPDKIPAHYGFDGQVDRWGSKYETLIFPAITIVFGFFMLAMAKFSSKQEGSGKNNEKVCIVTGIMSLLIFNAMTVYFLYTDFKEIGNLNAVPVSLNQILFGLLGAFMIVVGNLMPKLKRNSLIGLRTSWSMKNDVTWQKSQRFGGISFIVTGIIIIVINFVIRDYSSIFLSLAVAVLSLIIDIFYTYKVAKKYGDLED